MYCSYLIFARMPMLGRVKTRLAATLGDKTTLLLYSAMLEDTIRNVIQRLNESNGVVSGAIVFAYPPESASGLAMWLEERSLCHEKLLVLPQQGSTLGEQMFLAFQIAAERGLVPSIIIGADSPTLPQDTFTEAEAAILAGQACIGRADDGGFYLMGLPVVREEFFFGDDYSNETVYDRTREALLHEFPLLQELPVWVDIDNEESLLALAKLHQNSPPGNPPLKNSQTLVMMRSLGYLATK